MANGTPAELAAYKAGQIDAKLEQLAKHAESLNGSIEKGAIANAATAKSLQELVQIVAVLEARLKFAARIFLLGVGLLGTITAVANYITSH